MAKRFLIPLTFPLTIWIIHLTSEILNIPLYSLGILPRHLQGLLGIFTSPLIHSDFSHLISNSFPLVLLGFGIFYFYPQSAYKVFAFVYLCTGILVWLFAREVYHIGASGIVYAFVSYFFFNGLFRRDTRSVTLSLIVVFLYGGLVWGILPGLEGISWESHLFGAVSGMIASFVFRKSDPTKKYDWENDESEIPARELEVSYDPEKNKFLDEL
ncbi:MAG: rhomboid family intramembrane serine protease [Ignavibacterium sp.]|nr:rhomboid family intramembrane serine protease [Ignavibacterium sp.]MCX7612357.1 rhomboid family intramembrane serine protease [Ignavibacterium sp.]MDW8375458.1 rhomboid family intramembrane serine protease [Ignavibacteriales bacterium]